MVCAGFKCLLLLTSGGGQKKVPFLSLSNLPLLAPTSGMTLTGNQLEEVWEV